MSEEVCRREEFFVFEFCNYNYTLDELARGKHGGNCKRDNQAFAASLSDEWFGRQVILSGRCHSQQDRFLSKQQQRTHPQVQLLCQGRANTHRQRPHLSPLQLRLQDIRYMPTYPGLAYLKLALQNDFSYVIFDFSGSGISEGRYVSLGTCSYMQGSRILLGIRFVSSDKLCEEKYSVEC